MNHRLAKVARIAAVQKQIHRLAEWQLIDLRRREETLREQSRELITCLNDDTALHGLFVAPMAKRLTSIGIETGAVSKACEAQSERVLSEGRKLRHAERIYDRTAAGARREAEKVLLGEVIEAALTRPTAAAGPADQSGET
jgi:hypothetical protein